MFVTARKPWIAGGGTGTNSPPSEMIISNTLAVTTSGSNTEVELINEFSDLGFNDPLQQTTYSNNFCTVASDFTLLGPTGGVDGAVCSLRMETAGASSVVMTVDGSILIPDQLASLFPGSAFTIEPNMVVYMSIQFDDTYNGAWYISKFVTITS